MLRKVPQLSQRTWWNNFRFSPTTNPEGENYTKRRWKGRTWGRMRMWWKRKGERRRRERGEKGWKKSSGRRLRRRKRRWLIYRKRICKIWKELRKSWKKNPGEELQIRQHWGKKRENGHWITKNGKSWKKRPNEHWLTKNRKRYANMPQPVKKTTKK